MAKGIEVKNASNLGERKKQHKKDYSEPAVIWMCRQCGVYNLHPIDWCDFECINCKLVYNVGKIETIDWE